MLFFEVLISLLFAGAILTGLAQRMGAPYPAVLALGGTVLAVLPPEIPAVRLDPQLALALFVAPAILDAALGVSLKDLRDNWIPVSSLVLVAVCLTVAAVAAVAHALVPGLPWPAAVALGAIVAPPDAVAATSVLRRLSPPHRLMVIIEAEGLLNDATALLIYRLAVGVAMGGSLTAAEAVPTLLLNTIGSLAMGLALGWVHGRLTRAIQDLALLVVTQFVGTFAVWILAEEAGVSAVLTIVAFAVVVARSVPGYQNAENRRGSSAVWEVAIYVLNALAFLFVGLQLQEILKHLDGTIWPYVGFSLAILATVILVRMAWTFTYNLIARVLQRIVYPTFVPVSTVRSYKAATLVGWSGMRGLLTLATAFALPEATDASAGFPHRDLMIAAAFTVVLGTLVFQGLTVGPLMRRLKLADDGSLERDIDAARQQASRAGLAALEQDPAPEAAILRKEYGVLLHEEGFQALRPSVFARLRLKAVAAERTELDRLRRSRAIGEDAYRAIEEELDWAEGHARRRARRRPLPADASRSLPG